MSSLSFLLHKSSASSPSSLCIENLCHAKATHVPCRSLFSGCFGRRLSSSALCYVPEAHLLMLKVRCFENLRWSRPPTLTDLPFAAFMSHTGRPFDLVHSDLWTSLIPSISGYQYYLGVVMDRDPNASSQNGRALNKC
jgi:hypothetical protein